MTSFFLGGGEIKITLNNFYPFSTLFIFSLHEITKGEHFLKTDKKNEQTKVRI